MRIRWKLERVWKRMHAGILASRLERMAGHGGPVSLRTPEFLRAEMKLGIAFAALADVDYRLGNPGRAALAHARADQIHTALERFLPHAGLDPHQRAALERRMDRLHEFILRLAGETTAA